MAEELSKLAEQRAEAELNLESANDAVASAMKGKDIAAVRKAVNAADAAEKALAKIDRAYTDAKFQMDNGARIAAQEALHTYLTDTIMGIPEVASAFELGVPSFEVAYVDGAVKVTVRGAKAPGSSRSGNGTGGPKPRQFVRNRHNGAEIKSREWSENIDNHGDQKLADAAKAAGTKVTTKNGVSVNVGFQPHFKRVMALPAIQANWELVRRYKEEELVKA